MKAAIYCGKENIVIRESPLPEVGENDMLILFDCFGFV